MYKKQKILTPIILAAICCFCQAFGLFAGFDNMIGDSLLTNERPPMKNIVIIGMDERSINEIGAWPWPRFYLADAINKLTEYEAAVISASILYDAYSTEENDALLAEAARNANGRLVLGGMGFISSESSYFDAPVVEDYLLPYSELNRYVTVGFINASPDTDGVMRSALTSMQYGDIKIYSLAYETYKKYCSVMNLPQTDIPLDRYGMFPINYAAKPGSYTFYSLWGLINDEYNPSDFKDAIVLIGPYAQGIGEGNYATPLNRGEFTYGIEINANIIQNMIEGKYKEKSELWLNLSLMAFFAVLSVFVLQRLKPMRSVIFTVAESAVLLIAARLLYSRYDLVIDPGAIILFLVFSWLANMVLSILTAQSEKRHIQGLFGRFVAPEVVKELVSGEIEVQLGGSEKDITVLFVDIRGFTAFSEANPPETVVKMVNRYLDLTSRSIQENGGTIDKFIGDATMAVFNAPNELPDHAFCAVKAAWAMKQGSELLKYEIMRDYGVDLQFGVGVNTGSAVVGNMGSDFRMDYTAIGDTVNTAARLESNAQKGQILISDATYQLVKDRVDVTDLGILMVKNKKTGIQIYNLEGVKA